MRRPLARVRGALLAMVAVLAVVTAAGCTSSGPVRTTVPPGPGPTLSGGGSAAAGTTALGAKIDWSQSDELRGFATSLAGGSTFYELVWCQMEPTQGQIDWSTLDRIAQQSSQLGIQLMLKIRVGQCDWATGGQAARVRGSKNKTESLMPLDLGQYASFVSAVVSRYAPKGVHEYAVENEINGQGFWAGTPQEYLTLVGVAAKAIRAADPKAVVVDPGISSTAYGVGIAERLLQQGRVADAVAAYNQYYINRVDVRGNINSVSDESGLRAQLGDPQAQRNLDFLAMDAKLLASRVVDVRQIHFYETSASIPALFDYLRATTPVGMPIEAWEVGSFVRGKQDLTDDASTVELAKKVSLLLAGGARKVLWLPLLPSTTGRNPDEPRTGLIDPNGTVREAGRLYAEMAADARGSTWASVAADGLTGVSMTKDGRTVAYLWASGPDVTVSSAGGAITPVVASGSTSVITAAIPVRAVLTGDVQGLVR